MSAYDCPERKVVRPKSKLRLLSPKGRRSQERTTIHSIPPIRTLPHWCDSFSFQGSTTLQQQNCAANQFPRLKPRFCKIFLPKEPFSPKCIANSDLILEEVNGFCASDQLKVTIERGALAMICARAPNFFKRKGTCSFTDLGPQNAQSYRRAKAANYPQVWMVKFRKPSIRAILGYKIAYFCHQKTVYLISTL